MKTINGSILSLTIMSQIASAQSQPMQPQPMQPQPMQPQPMQPQPMQPQPMQPQPMQPQPMQPQPMQPQPMQPQPTSAVIAYQPPQLPPTVDRSRRGLTLGVALGMAGVADSSDSYSATNLRLFIGGWLRPTTAVVFDLDGYSLSSASFSIIGAGIQHNVSPRLFVGGTIGGAAVSVNAHTSETVLGVAARGGYTLFESRPHALNLSAEISAGLFASETVYAYGISIGYQLL
jgi:hypothetical protein